MIKNIIFDFGNVLAEFYPDRLTAACVDDEKALKDKKHLENALRNAAVSCYAIEGAYPPSAEYLIENYSVQVDEERFAVKYEFYGSNLMPDITVLVR